MTAARRARRIMPKAVVEGAPPQQDEPSPRLDGTERIMLMMHAKNKMQAADIAKLLHRHPSTVGRVLGHTGQESVDGPSGGQVL